MGGSKCSAVSDSSGGSKKIPCRDFCPAMAHPLISFQIGARQFVSKLFEHVIAALGTEHRLNNGVPPTKLTQTERVNRTLKTVIRAYVGEKHTSWDKYLPQICFALRTAPHESTGHSPAMMLYGRELETPLDLITQPSATGVDDPDILYPESLRASLQVAHDHARATLEASHTKRKLYYDQKRCKASYAVGDLVRVKTTQICC